jgi:CubicO group peptidase (beta-lactamase class C family)
MKHHVKNIQKLAGLTLLFIFVSSKTYPDLPSITPEEAGFDSTKLAEVTNQADAVYEAGLIPNYVIALAKDGKVFFSASRGNRIIGEVDPVGMDTLFPLASMSKPVASSALFKLIEEGKLSLGSELREFYPQFQSMFVAQNGDLDNQFQEAERAITILD